MAETGIALVLGASGTLGRRVLRLLARAAPDAEVVGAGRHPERAGTPRARRLDLDAPATWPAALEGARVLVHAAGPFRRDPRALAGACRDAGIHWVDIAEDPDFLAAVRTAYEAPDARACAVPGCSTVPGLVEALARGLPADRRAARVDAVLALGSRNPVSAGLLFGLLRPLGRPAPGGGAWFEALETHVFADGAVRRVGRYPSALEDGVACGEAPGAPRVPVRFRIGFDRAWLGRALTASARVLPSLSSPRLERLCRAAAPLAAAVRPLGTRHGRLAVRALDAGGALLAGVEVHAVRHGLDVPAAPAAWAAAALLDDACAWRGVRRLADLVPAPAVTAKLRELGCEVHELRGDPV